MEILNIFKREIPIKCPYCNEILVDPPKTKKKCPSCKKPVYFKIDPYTKKTYYLAEPEAMEIEKLQDRFRIEERFYNLFKGFGLTERYFKKRQTDYGEKAKGNYSAFAFVSSLFNELQLELAKKNDFHNLSWINLSMANFLYGYNVDCGHDHDFSPYLYESMKMELYDFKNQERQLNCKLKAEILSGGKCKKCDELNGKKFTIDEALQKMPLPVKDCENGFCHCTYFETLD